MTRSIRTVKREIRVLGLDTCSKGLALGAVVRGGLYLDGVIRHELGGRAEHGMAEAILESKYYPELRVLMLHDPRRRLDRVVLERLAGLPTVEVSVSNRLGKNFSLFQSEHGRVFYSSGLVSSVVGRILSTTWLYGGLPEPARIAHVLSRSASHLRAPAL